MAYKVNLVPIRKNVGCYNNSVKDSRLLFCTELDLPGCLGGCAHQADDLPEGDVKGTVATIPGLRRDGGGPATISAS